MQITCFSCFGSVNVTGHVQVGTEFDCPYCSLTNVVTKVASDDDPVKDLIGFGVALLGIFAIGKMIQHATDSYEGTGDGPEFRPAFKRQLKEEHVASNGRTCPRCDRRVRSLSSLHVDHKRTVKDGGGPWASNAQILCDWCNLEKGGNSSFFENLLGR